MKRTAIAATLLLSACGGDPTSSENLDPMLAQLSIVGEAKRKGTVATELTSPLEVTARVTDSPIGGLLVCFVAVTADAGAPWTPCTMTDQQGRASMRWTLGTKSGAFQVEARAMANNAPVSIASWDLEVAPGEPETTNIYTGIENVANGELFHLHGIGFFQDSYDNWIYFTAESNGGAFDVVSTGTTNNRSNSALSVRPGAKIGDTSHIRLIRADGRVLLEFTAELLAGKVNPATSWGAKFTKLP